MLYVDTAVSLHTGLLNLSYHKLAVKFTSLSYQTTKNPYRVTFHYIYIEMLNILFNEKIVGISNIFFIFQYFICK